MILKGATAQVIKSPVYSYQAECGIVESCKILDVPRDVQPLRSQLPAMLMEFQDDTGNVYHSPNLPQLKFSSKELIVDPVAGQSARWISPAPGVYQLQLPSLSITPIREELAFENAQKAVKCSVEVAVCGLPDQQGKTGQVAATFSIRAKPGSIFTVAAAALT